MNAIRPLLMIAATVALSGCGPSDSEVDAEFSEFCDNFFGKGAAGACDGSTEFTTAEKRAILESAPEIDEAFEDMEAKMDAELKRMDEEMQSNGL